MIKDLVPNIEEFNKAVAKVADTLAEEQLVLLHKKIVIELLHGVLMKTPVKTGRAKNNWQVGIGSAPDSVMGPIVRTNKHKIAADQSAKSAEAQRRAQARARPIIERIKAYQLVWLVNNADYISFLENGSSKQAPNGMLATTIAELTTYFP